MVEQKHIIKEKECAQMTRLCRSTRHTLSKEGKFPRPFKIGLRQNAWRYKDIEKWIEDRANDLDSIGNK
jgi:prophage regulatory protein